MEIRQRWTDGWRDWTEAPAEGRNCWLIRGLGVVAWLLFLSTWRLWTPQTVFPQVPLFGWACHLPPSADWLGLLALGLFLVGVVFAPSLRWQQAALVGMALSIFWLAALDQLRWQASAYHFTILRLMLAPLPAREVWAWVRALTVSIYLYSGWSKLDLTFAETQGRKMLDQLASFVGLTLEGWPAWLLILLALLLPLAEILVGLGLLLPKLRRAALIASLLMHVMLLLVLGPWGLNHSGGVILWNLFFLWQNPLLFTRSAAPPTSAPSFPLLTIPLRLLFSLVLFLPLLEPWSLCDTWAAWALYAPRPDRLELYLHEDDVAHLPPLAQRLTIPASNHYRRLLLDRWTLLELNVPLYPEPRYQLGLALSLSHHLPFDHPLLLHSLSPSSRLTGHRHTTLLHGPHQISLSSHRYTLNAQPRDRFRP